MRKLAAVLISMCLCVNSLSIGMGEVTSQSNGNPGVSRLSNPTSVLYSTDENLNFISIDPTTGLVTTIGPIGYSIEGLSFAPDGTLYATCDIEVTSLHGGAETLITIDINTGAGTIVGPMGYNDVDAMAFAPDGTLYGADFYSGNLIIINPSTGQGTEVGPLRYPGTSTKLFIGGMVHSSDGILYGSEVLNALGPTNLVTIDTSTATVNLVGPMGFETVEGLTFTDDGTLYGVTATVGGYPWYQTADLITIDPATGVGTFAYTLSIEDIDGLASIHFEENQPPVADAGPDQVVNEGDVVQFDGSGSTGTGVISVLHVSVWEHDELQMIIDYTGAADKFVVTQVSLSEFNLGNPGDLSVFDAIIFGINNGYEMNSAPIERTSELKGYVSSGGGIVWTHDTIELTWDYGLDLEEPAGLNFDAGLTQLVGLSTQDIEINMDHEVLHFPFHIGDIGDFIPKTPYPPPWYRYAHTTYGVVTTADIIIQHKTTPASTNYYLATHGYDEGRVVVDEIGHTVVSEDGTFLGIPSLKECQILVNAIHWAARGGETSGVLSYEWDFDAGDSLWWETGAVSDATGPTPTHVYGDNGVYTVTLRVTDDGGATDTDTSIVTVNNVAPAVSLNNTLLDTMDFGWTITTKSGGSAIVSGGYSSAQYTSPPTSIRAYLANGGMDGKDYGKVFADKDFNFNRLDHLKIRYYIAQQTDVSDGWGGIAARAEVRFITHDTSGDHTYRYIIAASETDISIPGPNDPSKYCEAQPDALFIDENNQIIPPPGDAELEPPTGVWYTLDRDVNNDFTVDWSTVEYITIQIAHYGVFMYLDVFETYFDDLELTCNMILADEGSPITVTATASDPGSDDLTITWNWGDGSPDTVITYYNDGTGPEPVYDPATNEIKSPWGTYPFNATDTAGHTYGDNGVYNITLTVEDDDGGTTTATISVTVNNVAPTIGSTTTPPGNEGSPITFTSTTTDPGSDDLTFTWDWGDGTSSTSTTYHNDGIGPDPYPSPLGIFPFTVTDTVTHTYGDNGVYTITLTVEDDDSETTVIATNVTVYNVAPIITLVVALSGDEGSPLTFTTDATDPGSDDLSFAWDFEHGPTMTYTYYNDGMNPDPAQSPGGNYPFNASDSATHTYGDDYNYTLVLTVTDDDGGITTYTTTITVDNVAPYIKELIIPYIGYEGTPSTFKATAVDYGSDDLTFEWEFGDWTPTITHIQYNDGTGPDPYPSPGGAYPFSAAHTLNHTYGDDSNYTLILTVTDDDGGQTIFTTTVIVHNVAPIIEPFGPFIVDEGSLLEITTTSADSGSDDLTFTWEFKMGPTITNVYYNDGVAPDPYPSPWGTYPYSVSDSVDHTYGDNGIYPVTLTVTDDDGGMTSFTSNVTVNNIAPTVEVISVTMDVEIGLRVAGRKYNNISMALYEDGNLIGTVSIERMPGSPNVQMAWIPVSINFSSSYTAIVTYIPEDPPNIGANPVWICIKSQNGSIKKIHHTFNVQQSKKRDSEHWNHVEPWEVDLMGNLTGCAFQVTTHITDPGSDDEILTYTYGNQTVTKVYLNNPPNPDPFPSPEINPRDITDTTYLIYEGPGIITVTVEDDDGLTIVGHIDL